MYAGENFKDISTVKGSPGKKEGGFFQLPALFIQPGITRFKVLDHQE
jgi:hypothetical protein